jgi:hypothetical protein
MIATIYGAEGGPLKLHQEGSQFILEDKNGSRQTCAETALSDILLRLRGDVLPYRSITLVPHAADD